MTDEKPPEKEPSISRESSGKENGEKKLPVNRQFVMLIVLVIVAAAAGLYFYLR